jgi:3-dehydroquinate synthase
MSALKTVTFSPRPPAPRIEVSIGDGLLDSDYLPELCRTSKRRIALIADAALAKTIGEKLKKRLSASLFIFDGGEPSKTRETKHRLEDELLKERFGRDTLLIALGGGVATDLVGFLASTYMRGVPLILIPTTLLAMVDASIGGKTGLDTSFGKNQIGTFYHPTAIIIDTAVLATLPQKEWLNGLAEILKYGLIGDASLWKFCEEHAAHWQKPDILSHLIQSSISAKMKVVEDDPEEKELRRILNFGHTVGHALEQISRYQIPHGAAVAMGTQAESYLSHLLGYLSENELKTILRLYKNFEFPVCLPKAFTAKQFFASMDLDKKSKGGQPRFVLIDRIGHALPFDGAYCRPISTSDFNALATWMELTHD